MAQFIRPRLKEQGGRLLRSMYNLLLEYKRMRTNISGEDPKRSVLFYVKRLLLVIMKYWIFFLFGRKNTGSFLKCMFEPSLKSYVLFEVDLN